MFERPKTAEKQLEVIDFVEKWMQGKDADMNKVRVSMGVIDEEIAKRNAQIERSKELISSGLGTEEELIENQKQLSKLQALRASAEVKMSKLVSNLEDAEEEIHINTESFKKNLN